MAVDETKSLIDTGEWKRDVLDCLNKLVEIEHERNEREKTRPDLARLFFEMISVASGKYEALKHRKP